MVQGPGPHREKGMDMTETRDNDSTDDRAENGAERARTAQADRLALKDAVLMAALPHVLFDGWSNETLRAAGRDLGLTAAEIGLLFPGGPRALAYWLDDWADRAMVAALESHDLAAMKIRVRVATAAMARFHALAPYKEAVRRAIALKASPSGAVEAARILYRTVDTIWYLAGDTATDFNFYTKRTLLAAALGPTVLFWLNDRSAGDSETGAFLDRRLADVMRLPGLAQGLRRRVESVTHPLRQFGAFAWRR